MVFQYGLPLAFNLDRAVRVSKDASRTVRAIALFSMCCLNFVQYMELGLVGKSRQECPLIQGTQTVMVDDYGQS
jgi:hypothetical protein